LVSSVLDMFLSLSSTTSSLQCVEMQTPGKSFNELVEGFVGALESMDGVVVSGSLISRISTIPVVVLVAARRSTRSRESDQC
jgi:cobyrinic acid a,c-diamide synthase